MIFDRPLKIVLGIHRINHGNGCCCDCSRISDAHFLVVLLEPNHNLRIDTFLPYLYTSLRFLFYNSCPNRIATCTWFCGFAFVCAGDIRIASLFDCFLLCLTITAILEAYLIRIYNIIDGDRK